MFSRSLKQQLNLHQHLLKITRGMEFIDSSKMANNIELLQEVDTIQKNYLKETCIQVNEQDEPIGKIIYNTATLIYIHINLYNSRSSYKTGLPYATLVTL